MNNWKQGDPERRANYNREPEDLGWIKKALVTSIIGLTAHMAGGIWWAATQTAKVDFVQVSLDSLKQDLKDSLSDRYRSSDATKDVSVINARIDRNEVRLSNLEKAVSNISSGAIKKFE